MARVKDTRRKRTQAEEDELRAKAQAVWDLILIRHPETQGDTSYMEVLKDLNRGMSIWQIFSLAKLSESYYKPKPPKGEPQ